MKNLKVILSVLPLLFFIACGNNEKYPSVEYKYQTTNFNFGNCDSVNFECVNIKIKSVELFGPIKSSVKDSLTRKVNNFILAPTVGEIGYTSLEELRDSLIDNYKRTRIEIPDMKVGYELERNIKVETDTLGIFAMEFYEFTFFGGAHPNYFTTFRNVDLTSGKEIKLNELLQNGFENELNKIGEEIFRNQKQLKPDENLEEAGFWFNEGKFKLNDNFLITKAGLKFFFNSYEIGPYAIGTTELLIPFSRIKNILKDNSVLKKFI